MEVGIGLPNAVDGVRGQQILDWAREAEGAGFSSLGTIDRIVYSSFEPLMALTAAAAVTERIRLATGILLAPLRSNTALLAKQSAGLDNLSDGRLVLGMAVGGREDDYSASGVDFSSRGRIFDAQLDELKRLWRGEGGVGPAPATEGGPTVIIGGAVDAAFRRAARYGAGWMMGGGPPDRFGPAVAKLQQAWSDAGREGQPRKMALAYFSLGPNAERNANAKLGHYYSFLGDYAQQLADSAAKDADTVKGYVAAFEQAGCDELILFPSDADPEQVGLLREALG